MKSFHPLHAGLLVLPLLVACGGGDGGIPSEEEEGEVGIQEIEDNDNLQQANANGDIATLVSGETVTVLGRVYSEEDPNDSEVDRDDNFRFAVPADINVTVTVTPQDQADLYLLLGGPGGNPLITEPPFFEDSNGAGGAETYSLDITGGDEFYVGVVYNFLSGTTVPTDYVLTIEASPSTGLVTGGDEGFNIASVSHPLLRYWLDKNGLLPEQSEVVQRQLGWIVIDGEVHDFTQEVLLED